jgi:hypothetical protein
MAFLWKDLACKVNLCKKSFMRSTVGRKCLAVINPLAYSGSVSMTKFKSFIRLSPARSRREWRPRPVNNRAILITQQCKKTAVLSCNRCLINTGVKNEQYLKIEKNFDHQMCLRVNVGNRTACIRCQCRKTDVLSCHRCLINTGDEKMNNI